MPQDDSTGSPSLRAPPFGIGEEHISPRSTGWVRRSLTVLLIGVPLAAALLGLLGGGNDEATTARARQAALTVEMPRVLRSGNWFETLVTVEPAADIKDLAIAIDQPLWRGMSIDTAVPDADKVEALDGRFTYTFGPLKRGERFVFKLDGQIQPRGLRRLSGRISALDGERELAGLPVEVLVLP